MDPDKKIATRQSYGEAFEDLGKENKDIVVLDADLSTATKTNIFAKELFVLINYTYEKDFYSYLYDGINVICICKLFCINF